jgi:hypothetical protein
MTHTLELLPAIGCAAMMLGTGALTRRLARTPLTNAALKRLIRLIPGKNQDADAHFRRIGSR